VRRAGLRGHGDDAAALDLGSAALLPWNPDVNDYLTGLAVSGTTVNLAGWFTFANGTTSRGRGAAVDSTTGALRPWNPSLDADASALAMSGSAVYLGGRCAHASGAQRPRFAAVDATTGAVLPWNPAFGGEVGALGALCGTGGLAAGDTSARSAGLHAAVLGCLVAWVSDT